MNHRLVPLSAPSPAPPTDRDQLPCWIEPELRRVLRALRRFRRFDHRLRPDLLEDLRQELVLDYFQNRRQIERLSQPERRERWMRLAGRAHYRISAGVQRRIDPGSEPDSCAGLGLRGLEALEPWLACEEVAPQCVALARTLVEKGTWFRNGRLNARATARALRCAAWRMRATIRELGDALGRGREHVQFWSWRLAEGLLGLASDLLRDRALVRVHGECQRRRPDPSGRRRGIARARRMLRSCSLPPFVAGVKRRSSEGRLERRSPLDLLADARLLWPDHPAIALWTFEAACAASDHRLAVRSLREARRLGSAGVPLVLAKARLHELRGRDGAARRLLAKAARLYPRDERILASLEALR
jgi:hypothetical protein